MTSAATVASAIFVGSENNLVMGFHPPGQGPGAEAPGPSPDSHMQPTVGGLTLPDHDQLRTGSMVAGAELHVVHASRYGKARLVGAVPVHVVASCAG